MSKQRDEMIERAKEFTKRHRDHDGYTIRDVSYEDLADFALSEIERNDAENRRIKDQLGQTQEALRALYHLLTNDKWFALHPLTKAEALRKAGELV